MQPISPLAVPILTGLIGFSIVGRVLTLLQRPKEHTQSDTYVLVEFICGFLVCLSIVLKAPIQVRYICYFFLFLSFVAANVYKWWSLLKYESIAEQETIVIALKTLGDQQNVALVGAPVPVAPMPVEETEEVKPVKESQKDEKLNAP